MLKRLSVLCCLVLLAGCGTLDMADRASRNQPTATAQGWGCAGDGNTFAGDIELARCLTEEFWSRSFAQSGRTYQPIQDFIAYNGDDGPACGDQRSVPNNAFYCPAGHFIAYDESWLAGMYEQLGDAAVYLIIPHEFGHSVQRQLRAQSDFNQQLELQADCYAGGTLSALVQAQQLRAEEGDDQELVNNLEAAGDPTDAWWDPNAHGTAQQRTASFVEGYESGVGTC